MKVILLEDVRKTGKKFDVVDLSDGYALNFLIPQGKAKTATEGEIAQLEQQKEQRVQKQKESEESLIALLDKINGSTITVSRKANDKGSLFAGMTIQEVAQAVSDEVGEAIASDYITIDEDPLKHTGEHTLTITVGEKKADLTLAIEQEK